MRTLALSGWGQPYDALSAVAPDALHLDYARCASTQEALSLIAGQGECHAAIGWSLGGQLLVRALASGAFYVKYLILMAAPFRFVATTENSLGMKPDLYDKFRGNYARAPERTLHKGWELLTRGDSHPERIRAQLERQDKQEVLSNDWLGWLDRLNGFGCEELDMSGFPPTLLIHGAQDAVVGVEQSGRFAEALPKARLERLEACGHAPHWHDGQKVQRLITEHTCV